MARSLPRVIILIDMDCFYASVEQRERPELRGHPVVVVQGHEFKGGGIIAVSYEARTFGVTRNGMRANEAVAKCPELAVCYVPERHGKADLTRYRSVGAEVIKVVSRFADIVERASVDEAFLDVTDAVQKRLAAGDLDVQNLDSVLPHLPSTFVAGFPSLVTRTEAASSSPGANCTAGAARPVQPVATLPATRHDVRVPGAAWTAGGGDEEEDGYDEELVGVEGDGLVVDEDLADVESAAVAAAASGSKESLKAWHDQCRDEQSLALLVGAVIASEVRHAVLTEAGVSCSAGVAENKMLAKLACGIHKPAQQTILPVSSVPGVFADLPFKKVRNLGGSFGKSVQATLNCSSVGAVAAFPAADLQRHFGEKMGCWLFEVCRGICREPVKERRLAQSLGSSKNFPGPKKLVSHEQVRYWLLQYAKELVERISVDEAMNDRLPSHFSVHVLHEGEEKPLARSCRCPSSVFSSVPELMEKAYLLLLSSARPRPRALGPESERPGPSPWYPGVVNVGICCDQFKSIKATKNTASITQFFRAPAAAQASSDANADTACSAAKSRATTTAEVTPACEPTGLASETPSAASAEALAVDAVGETVCLSSGCAVTVAVTCGTPAVPSPSASAVSTAAGIGRTPLLSDSAVPVTVPSGTSPLSSDCAGAVSTAACIAACIASPTDAAVPNAPLPPDCAVAAAVTGGGPSFLPSACDVAVSSASCTSSASPTGSATVPTTSASAAPPSARSVAAGSVSEPVLLDDIIQLPGPCEAPPVAAVDVDDGLVFSTEDWQRCRLCGNGVFAWMIPEHRDFHFAQSLKAQDRLALRKASDAGKTPRPSPAPKTAKTPQRNTAASRLSSRASRTFFQAPLPTVAAGSAACPVSGCADSAERECAPLSAAVPMAEKTSESMPAREHSCAASMATSPASAAAVAVAVAIQSGRSSPLVAGADEVSTAGEGACVSPRDAGAVPSTCGDPSLRPDSPEAVIAISGTSTPLAGSPRAVPRTSDDLTLSCAAAAAPVTSAGSIPLSPERATAVTGTTSLPAERVAAVSSTSGNTGMPPASSAGSTGEPLPSDDIFETPGPRDTPPLTVDDSLVLSLEDWQLCKLCGKGVSSLLVPEHRDFHFAESLREQDRMAMKEACEARKTQLPSPASKRVKTPQRNTPKPKPSSRPITNFFAKKST